MGNYEYSIMKSYNVSVAPLLLLCDYLVYMVAHLVVASHGLFLFRFCYCVSFILLIVAFIYFCSVSLYVPIILLMVKFGV